jgi:hypothetical protein
MRHRLTYVLVLGLLLVGCAHDLKVHPPQNHGDIYLLYYHPWDEMLNEYGPGADVVRAFEEATLKCLEQRSLVPTECSKGVVIISSQQNEGGGGNTAFKCK